MVSIQTLRREMYKICKLAEKDGITIKVGYKARVYMLSFEPTSETYRPFGSQKKRKRYINKRGKVPLEMEDCKTCGHVVVARICINEKCDSNTQPKLNTPVAQYQPTSNNQP